MLAKRHLLVALLSVCVGPFGLPARELRAEASAAGAARRAPIYVLELDTDDAEPQAEALSNALRSRVRSSAHFRLLDTTQSLSTLIVALRCPPKPDAACLGRIGEQLRTDQFLWGTIARQPQGKVAVELHQWSRGRPDKSVRDTYPVTLTDQADETLGKVAARLFDKVTGDQGMGVLALTVTGSESAEVLLDGEPIGRLTGGRGRFDVAAGKHTVEVREASGAKASRAITVDGSSDAQVTLTLPIAHDPASDHPPLPVRKIVSYSLIGVGTAVFAVGAYEGLHFMSLRGELNDSRAKVPSNITDVCSYEAQSYPDAVAACSKLDEARSARTLGLVLAGAGIAVAGAGVVLLVTEPSKADEKRARVRFFPHAGPHGAGVDVVGAF